MQDTGPNKIAVIKVMREFLGLGLKESKDLVESAPCLVVERDDAGGLEQFRQALLAAGATLK